MKKFLIAAGVLILGLTLMNASFAAQIPKAVGVNIRYTGISNSDMDTIKAAGMTMARTDLKWAVVERTKGQYSWSHYDGVINGLIAKGITPYMILDYNNPAYGASNELAGITNNTQIQGYTNFAKAAVARYKGKGIIWEIWNEPNLDVFWNTGPNVTQYMNLVKSAAPAMKAADPNCIIVAPGVAFIANTMDYLNQCCQQGLLNYIDGLSLHPYKDSNPEAGSVNYLYTTVKNMVANHGKPDFPIIAGEWGFATSWPSVQGEQNQAEFLARQLIMHDYYNVPISIIYDYKNDGTDPNNHEHNFGLLRADGSKKPAYTAVKAYLDATKGLTFSKKVNTSDSSVYLYEYTGSAGRTMAAWTTGSNKSASIYGKTVTLSQMPVYVKDAATPEPEPEPEPTPCPEPENTTAPTINNVKLAIKARTGQYYAVINWADRSENETGFEIYQSINNTDNFELIKTINALPGTQKVKYKYEIGTNPTFGTYYYRVIAKYADNSTENSNIAMINVKEYTPPTPNKLSATSAVDTDDTKVIILRWDDVSPNEDGFYIYYSTTQNGTFNKIGTISKDSTTVVHTTNTNGFYKVNSFNEAGESKESMITGVDAS